MIFPFDDFSFCYSAITSSIPATAYNFPDIEVEGYLIKDSYTLDKRDFYLKHVEVTPEYAKEFVQLNQFKKDNLGYALSKTQDVWIKGKYLAVSCLYKDELLKKLDPDVQHLSLVEPDVNDFHSLPKIK